MQTDLFLIGTGSLARSIAYSLSTARCPKLVVCVCGRTLSKVDEVVVISNSRAASVGGLIHFFGSVVDWEEQDSVSEALHKFLPRLILIATSYQSPWEVYEQHSAWTKLLSEGGFGVTIPFQARLALQILSALSTMSHRCTVLNACYPDAVNALLKCRGYSVLCGIGNIAILAAVAGAKDRRESKLKILAHHYHLSRILAGDSGESDGPIVWYDSTLISAPKAFDLVRAARGRELNHITGCTAIPLILALLFNLSLEAHVPGPNGLPGGYPVRIQSGDLAVIVPPGMTSAEAVNFNLSAGVKDGVTVVPQSGQVVFSDQARHSIEKHSPSLANSFHAGELEDVFVNFLALREKLRKM